MSKDQNEDALLGFMVIMRQMGHVPTDIGGAIFTDDAITALARLLAETRHLLSNAQVRMLISLGSLMCRQQAREEEARELTDQFLGLDYDRGAK